MSTRDRDRDRPVRSPEPECFRLFAEQLAYLGISADDIRHMVAANPRRFLGLPESRR